MADSILRLKVESQEYDNKLKKAAEGLNRYVDGCRKVGGTLEVVEKDTLDYVRALGRMETSSRTATGKLAEMKKSFVEISAQYKQMTDAEKASPFGKALATSLDQLKGRITESKAELDDINKSINGGGGLSGALDAVAGKFGLNVDQLTKFGGALGIATTAAQVAKDAFFQSESGIDEWGRTVEGAKGAYSVFLDTLNNGNWSNFFQNLSAAIKGGRDLYDVFDRLGSIKSNNAAAIAITQKEIAELRLAKQQGQDVDAKLKAATGRLAALQKQGVSAGMNAGSASAFQTIRNGVNSIGGTGLNDATINYAVQQIMRNGQSEFDKYKRNYEILRQRGMVTRTQTIADSQGGTYERQYKEFDINALTVEQRKQYALAKSITEGETRIQQGIAAYAQAVSEGTSAAREQFKGNRYALQGAGGGGGSRSTKTEPTYAADSIAAMEAEVSMLTKAWKEAGAAVRDDYAAQLKEAQLRLDNVMGKDSSIAFNPEQAARQLEVVQGKNVAEIPLSSEVSFNEWLTGVQDQLANLEFEPIEIPIESTQKDIEAIVKSARTTAEVVGSIGDAFNAIEDPAAKVMGTVAQAVASVALSYAQAMVQATSMGPWAWVAFAATGLATMISTISAIHSSTGYAEGGIVKGNHYSGDMMDGGSFGINAGELVLNKAQQRNLAQNLQGGGMGSMQLKTKVRGTELLVWLDNSLAQSGRGELVTWGT